MKVNLDGTGIIKTNSGIKYFDHLITTLGTHSLIDITIIAQGDLKHHLIEDVAICLGQALRNAIGEGLGINRFGYAIVPMDCSLAFTAIDLVRRPYHKIDLKISGETIEDMMQEDIIHFLETLASSLQVNMHIWTQYGDNDHHKVEAAFKSLALSLKEAIKVNPRRVNIPSAKGAM
ncbi:imidazoleglycerol-phosphate dehydratase [Candidatus Bathyarchaeota archaeon]|nr:imidazoleglycerol-phosphate dehydratase [Candidatus Bathyarchaeota archaeon]